MRWRLLGMLLSLGLVAVIWIGTVREAPRIADDLTPQPPSQPNLNAQLLSPDQSIGQRFAESTPVSASGRTQAEASDRLGLPCGLSLAGEAGGLAMITLHIADPCRPDTQMMIEHGGLRFTVETDFTGSAEVSVPALQSPANIVLAQSSGATQTVWVSVPELAAYHRVALYWTADAPMELRAESRTSEARGIERTQAQPGQADDVLRGDGGHLMTFGSADTASPILAHVYTAPRDAIGPPRNVRFSLEIPIDAQSCGQVARGGIAQTGLTGGLSQMELEVPLPACDGQNSVLRLPNLLRDLTLGSG